MVSLNLSRNVDEFFLLKKASPERFSDAPRAQGEAAARLAGRTNGCPVDTSQPKAEKRRPSRKARQVAFAHVSEQKTEGLMTYS